jgi:hypothetical protein
MSYLYCPELVWSNPKLTLTEKVLLGRIIALSNKYGYCNASNKFFEDELNLTQSTITKHIGNLTNKGYLKRVVLTDDKKQVVERRLYFQFEVPELTDTSSKNCYTLPPKTAIPSPQNLLGTLDLTLDVSNSKEFDFDEQIKTLYGIEPAPIPDKKKSKKITQEDGMINTSILLEIKKATLLKDLPMSVKQQRIFANFIRARLKSVMPPDGYNEKDLISLLNEVITNMARDNFMKDKMGDLKLFYYRMVLFHPVFKDSKAYKKEVYL